MIHKTLAKFLNGSVIIALAVGSLWSTPKQPAVAQEVTPTPPASATTEAQALEQLGAVISYGENGRANFMSFASSEQSAPQVLFAPGVTDPAEVARIFLRSYGGVFGVQDAAQELRVKSQHSTGGKGNGAFVRFQQTFQGVPVLGGELIVQLDSGNNVRSANGEISPGLTLSTAPRIDAATATQTALEAMAKWYAVDVETLAATQPELWVYDPSLIGPETGPVQLVWRLEVSATTLDPIREFVLVETQQGRIALHFNQVDAIGSVAVANGDTVAPVAGSSPSVSSVGGSPDLATYTANNTFTLPGTLLCTEAVTDCTSGGGNNPDADAAHTYARDTYNFYWNTLGRDSIDGAGIQIISSVDYGVNYQNAFWDGLQMAYGDGFSLADDVVGHELTHGVTQYESNLLYYYQSGAINESFSDVFGEFVDLTNGAGSDALTDRWKVGEDLPPSIGAIRNMQDPTLFGDPDKMTSANYQEGSCWYYPIDPPYGCNNGGVHTNSGVNNKAAYLMTDGGTFNGKTVTALGIDKTARIYYAAQSNLLTSGADYGDLYNALYQSCQNLTGTAGITVFDCQEVRDATDAVEMNVQPASGYNTDAPICATGQAPSDLFYDGFESGTGNWTFAALAGVNRWQLDSPLSGYGPTAAHTGLHSLYADDGDPSTSDSYAAMTNGITLPANAYLHFAHNYGFETSVGGATLYDGGVLEYSTTGLNGTWLDANGLLDGTASPNNGYDGTLTSGNPLGTRSAFADDSHGYISSRYNLSSLSGQTIRFRWRMGTDSSVADAGWWLDDVRIYTCVTDPNPPTFADVPFDYWAYDYIESLWDNNFVAGCQSTPTRLYCPDTTLSRAEIAVFVVRGVHGAAYTPADPVSPPFTDVPLGQWYTKWVNQLKVDGYTAGCGSGNYCPLSGHNRAEASVFFMRMYQNNPAYDPTTDPNGPFGVGNVFADMPLTYWGTKWAEAAYYYNLIEPCETIPALKFCPTDPMTRATAAYMMVQAKGLPLP